MSKGKLMMAKKVWLHTGGSQCSYCGAEIKVSTIRDHTNWSIEDPKGQFGLDICAKHQPRRLESWLSKVMGYPVTVVIETGSI